MQLFDSKWDDERVGIFEPIPFKGDENMTVDATNRPIFDDEDTDATENHGSASFNNNNKSKAPSAANGNTSKTTSNTVGNDNMIDLDSILSGGPSHSSAGPGYG